MNAEAHVVKVGRRKVVRVDLTLDLARALLDDLSEMHEAKPRWKMLRDALWSAEDQRVESLRK